MSYSQDYDDRAPFFWVGRLPVFLTTALVATHVLTMIFVALLMALGQGDTIAALSFSTQSILSHFAIWEFFTYVFVNRPSIWFAIEMYLLLVFGTEVEKRIGHKGFGWMYLALTLAIPTVLTGAAAFGVQSAYAGSGAVHFAIFVAFVAIYPTAQIFFGLQARWIALILFSINSLMAIAGRSWVSLSMLWLAVGCALFMLHRAGVSSSGLFRGMDSIIPPTPREPKLARPQSKKKPSPPPPDPYESIDPLLEKISKHGIHSLTKAERQKLEKARALLLERERRR